MIGETHRQLKDYVTVPMTIAFVLLPEQKDVYNAFVDQLNLITQRDDTPTDIAFDKQSISIDMHCHRMKFSF